MTEAQKCLYHIAENMRMAKSISKEGYEYFQQAIKALEQKPCEDCISRQTLIERINNSEENFKSDNMESIASDDGDPFVDGVLSGVFNIRLMVMQAPPVTPKPKTDALDKTRAEIMDFEEELFHRPNTDYADYAAVRHCVEIIDKYKAESEE